MPTENRSSNTEMVSVPRFSLEAARDCLVTCQDQAFQSCECESCPQCGLMPDECTDTECSKTCQCTTCDHCMNKDSIDSLTTLLAQPAPQPHPEPIAWMVGTAIWWTKEEAERDASATGQSINPVGPTLDASEVERLKQELLVARAQGRAEVVEMIAQLDAETGLDEFIGSHAIADTGDYGSHWNEDELRLHFNADPAAASELEMCRYSAHQIIQLEREEEQLRTHINTQKSWMDRFVEYLTESGVPEDLLAEYKAITAARF